MKYQITKFSIAQTSKVAALLYALFGLVLLPFGCFFLTQVSGDRTNFMVGILYILAPVWYGLLGYVFTAIALWVYNLIAARIGGIEFDLKEHPPLVS